MFFLQYTKLDESVEKIKISDKSNISIGGTPIDDVYLVGLPEKYAQIMMLDGFAVLKSEDNLNIIEVNDGDFNSEYFLSKDDVISLLSFKINVLFEESQSGQVNTAEISTEFEKIFNDQSNAISSIADAPIEKNYWAIFSCISGANKGNKIIADNSHKALVLKSGRATVVACFTMGKIFITPADGPAIIVGKVRAEPGKRFQLNDGAIFAMDGAAWKMQLP